VGQHVQALHGPVLSMVLRNPGHILMFVELADAQCLQLVLVSSTTPRAINQDVGEVARVLARRGSRYQMAGLPLVS